MAKPYSQTPLRRARVGTHSPASQRQRVLEFVSPLVADLIFYEVEPDDRGGKPGDHPDYGSAYPGQGFPDHVLTLVTEHDDDTGQFLRYYYAADRATQDLYNFEHTKTELGGQKYDTITRTYIIKREDYDPDDPEVGVVMVDSPAGQFTAAGYVLLTKEQKKAPKELDGFFIIEQRVFIKRVALYSTSYDDNTHGVLVQTEVLYHRGETYNAGANIEAEISDETKWGVSTEGVQTYAQQLSEDWFLVTSTDVIPQDKVVTGAKFGGLVTRSYQTYITYSWPAVLGNDGTKIGGSGGSDVGDIGIEIMDWEDKEGGSRNYVRPLFEEHGYRGPTRALITEEWSKTIPTLSSDAERPFIMRPLPIVYNSPYLTVQIPPTLHGAVSLICDTSSSDPTWGENDGSERYYPETNVTEWPASLVATVEVTPLRGGYLTRHVTVYKPEFLP